MPAMFPSTGRFCHRYNLDVDRNVGKLYNPTTMNIGTITTMGAKGQIVIPHKMRKALDITESTPLQVVQIGGSISIHPLQSVARLADGGNAYLKVLEKTRGAWAGQPDYYKAYRKREKIRAKKMRNAW